MSTNIYGGTLGSLLLALFARTYKQRLAKEFVLRIDFDVASENFIVLMPPTNVLAFGEPYRLEVTPADFQMLTNEQQKESKSSLYFDAKTGYRFATINRGIWYNQGLLLYLL